AAVVPPEILLPCAVPDRAVLEEWLSQHRGKRVRIEIPVRGDKRRLLDLAADNAREAVEQEQVKWLTDSQKTAAALTELKEALELPTLPVRLECFDISTIQGTSTVASMVVFENGKPRTDAYRRFRIKTVDGTDDFAAMREVLTRRLKRSGLATSPHAPSPSPLEGEGEHATSIEGSEGEHATSIEGREGESGTSADGGEGGPGTSASGGEGVGSHELGGEASPLPAPGEGPGVRAAGAEGGEDGTEWTRRPDLIIV